MGIVGEAAVGAVAGPPAVLVGAEDPHQPRGQLAGHLAEIHQPARAGRAFDPQRVAVEVVVALQGLDQQIVHGNQTGPRQLELPPNSRERRFAGLVVDALLRRRPSRHTGWSLWTRDSERTPNGERNSFSSSM